MRPDDWVAAGAFVARPSGARPPWADLSSGFRPRVDADLVRAAFRRRPAPLPALRAAHLRAAAVLVLLFEHDDDVRVVFIKRSTEVGTHRGDVAFPGGVLDPGETPQDAALREAEEELGIPAEGVEIVGRLSDIPATQTGFFITPIVGLTRLRPDYVPNRREIDAVFDVALADLLDPDRYREEIWEPSAGAGAVISFFELPGGTAWGATAMLLVELLEILTAGWPAAG